MNFDSASIYPHFWYFFFRLFFCCSCCDFSYGFLLWRYGALVLDKLFICLCVWVCRRDFLGNCMRVFCICVYVCMYNVELFFWQVTWKVINHLCLVSCSFRWLFSWLFGWLAGWADWLMGTYFFFLVFFFCLLLLALYNMIYEFKKTFFYLSCCRCFYCFSFSLALFYSKMSVCWCRRPVIPVTAT